MLVSCASQQPFLWKDTAKRSAESLQALVKDKEELDSQLAAQSAAGALIRVIASSHATPEILGFGDSPTLAAEQVSGGLHCSDNRATTIFFVYKRLSDSPVQTLSCDTLSADVSAVVGFRDSLNSLKSSVSELQTKLATYDADIKQNDEMLASDLKLTLYQQAYIKQHSKMLDRLSAEVKKISDGLIAVSKSAETEANANKALLTEVNQKLDDIANQLKKF
jgi:hypothetical protein